MADASSESKSSLAEEVRAAVRLALEERERTVLDAALEAERGKREELERRVSELIEESQRSRKMLEEAERRRVIQSELERLGVRNVELAYRAVQSEVVRTAEGQLVGRCASGDVELREYLVSFVDKNPELMPARMWGGAGASAGSSDKYSDRVDLESIRPGMPREDLEKARRQVMEVFSQSVRGR